MSQIHPTAIIDKHATLGKDVIIGPYSVIGEHVTLGDKVEVKSHVVIEGHTQIGNGSTIFPFASIGTIPQDLKFHGEQSKLIIGEHTIIREHVTINPGTEGGGMVTKIGDRCLLMIGVHIAHDCLLGNHVILANNATLAGHVEIGDYAVIGGLAAIHQFVRIGHHAMIGGMSGIEHDVIPYGQAMGERAGLTGLNLTGLKRRNFERDAIHALRGAYKTLFNQDAQTFAKRLNDIENEYKDQKEVMEVVIFLKTETSRAICLPK